MKSNNPRSAPVINDHLLIVQVSGEYSSDRRKVEKTAAITPAMNIMINFFICGVTHH
jgi:hypothetical protein